jgi:GNAT superfamily N-acetyltransferase
MTNVLNVRVATADDVPDIMRFIRELAEYEHLSHEVVATEDDLRRELFCEDPVPRALIGEIDGKAAGFALYFLNFSTFLGKPGIYIEDLFVRKAARGCGLGRALLRRLARICDTWRALPPMRAMGESNGRYSTGTNPPSSSISSWVRCRWTSGPFFD